MLLRDRQFFDRYNSRPFSASANCLDVIVAHVEQRPNFFEHHPTFTHLNDRDCILARDLADATTRYSAPDIFLVSNGLKVVGIHTSRYTAQMI